MTGLALHLASSSPTKRVADRSNSCKGSVFDPEIEAKRLSEAEVFCLREMNPNLTMVQIYLVFAPYSLSDTASYQSTFPNQVASCTI